MKIDLQKIRPNPHRDLRRNPIDPAQVDKLKASIDRTGFWDNVVVRKSPTERGAFELAYGHNRLAALGCPSIVDGVDLTQESAEFIVRDLNDYDMLVAMSDENATQQNITPKIIFENVTAAILLAEKLLGSTNSVDEFNEVAKTSHCLTSDNVQKTPPWRANEYEKAKEAIASGEGLGRGFLIHFLPKSARVDNNTIQAAIDSHYADSRKAAAEAEAAQLAAEAERLEREAEEADARARETKVKREAERAKKKAETNRTKAAATKAKAEETKAKADALEHRGVDRDLLERLPTQSHMAQIVAAIRTNKIPKGKHEALIEACIAEGWSTSTSSAIRHPIGSMAASWWYRHSGQEAKDRAQSQKDAKRWKHRDKSLDEFCAELVTHTKKLIAELNAVAPYADQIQRPALRRNMPGLMDDLISAADSVRVGIVESDDAVVAQHLKALPGGRS